MMNQENIHIMGMGIWWIVGLLILAFGLCFFGIYILKIYHYRSRKGIKLDLLRNLYIDGEITEDELIELIRELK